MFITRSSLLGGSWQALERSLCRLLICEGFTSVRAVGGSGDGGADVIAHKNGRRFLYQVKHWKAKVGSRVVDETVRAARLYHADVPVVVALHGFDSEALRAREKLRANGIPISFVNASDLEQRAASLRPASTPPPARRYQEPIVASVVQAWLRQQRAGLVLMATGLGKTFVAAEAVRRINNLQGLRVLVLAHTNALVYQLERSFWPFLEADQATVVWNAAEKPSHDIMESAFATFACQASVSEAISRNETLPDFNMVLIDECHHAGAAGYQSIIGELCQTGFLLGMTATPWRGDDADIFTTFGPPLASLDMVEGMRQGYLSNVDYRIYTDNIDWKRLTELHGHSFSPREINRTLFIKEWNDSVVAELGRTWKEQPDPRCIVFCGTIDHAITMRDKINAMGFCRAEALYSSSGGRASLSAVERQRILCDFQDGRVQVICVVDIFNEGIDVPDVNIVVFQRVTHSRRIFVQQLGRGLRISQGKEKVIVLDFANDIRRFAATIELKDSLSTAHVGSSKYVSVNHKVEFRRADSSDPSGESFLRQWLTEVADIADANDDKSVLRYPPPQILSSR